MEKYVVRNFPRPDEKYISEFEKLDVSTVYEAQGKQGLMHHRIRPIQTGKLVCGSAVTVTCYAGDNLMIHAAIEVCKPGDILVVSTIGESVNGMIGELIVRGLMAKGVQGVIIDAGVRDVERVRKLGFPIWSRAIHSQGTTKALGGWVNAPTLCGEVNVNPGDLILADDDGVVVVKQEELQESLEASHKLIEKEESVKEKIANGEISVDFHHLRPVLKKANVVYYDDIKDVQSVPKVRS